MTREYRDKDRDRDKRPSWSEIDKKKDSSHHVDRADPYAKEKKKVTTGYGRYKDQLDALFSSGKKAELVRAVLGRSTAGSDLSEGEAPERQKRLREIREAAGDAKVAALIDAFAREFGELPDDVEVLTQALVHHDDEVKAGALRRISAHLDGHVLERKALLLERAKGLAVNSDDVEVLNLAREVKRKLGG